MASPASLREQTAATVQNMLDLLRDLLTRARDFIANGAHGAQKCSALCQRESRNIRFEFVCGQARHDPIENLAHGPAHVGAPADSLPMQLSVGDSLGPYEIVARIGAGG